MQIKDNFNNRQPEKARLGAKGFTLVELMAAISILGIIAVMATPPFLQWNTNRRLMKQARNLFSHMQQAKLEAIRNNCDVVLSFNLPGNYLIFRDDSGGIGNQIQDAGELTVATVPMDLDVVMQIPAGLFGGTTICGFTSRGLPILGRTGNVVLRRNGLSDRWYRVVLGPSGQVTLQISSNSTDGVDGTWN